MEALIVDALRDFNTFKELTETIPTEVLAAEAASLTKGQQQKFQEYCEQLNQEKKQLKVNQIVEYTNPDKIAKFQKFENVDLTIVLLLPQAELAICRLPNGSEETFGLWTLKTVEW